MPSNTQTKKTRHIPGLPWNKMWAVPWTASQRKSRRGVLESGAAKAATKASGTWNVNVAMAPSVQRSLVPCPSPGNSDSRGLYLWLFCSYVSLLPHFPPDCFLILLLISLLTNRLFCKWIPFMPTEFQLPETKDAKQFVFSSIISSGALECSPVEERTWSPPLTIWTGSRKTGVYQLHDSCTTVLPQFCKHPWNANWK